MANLIVSFEWIGKCTEIECTNKALMVCRLHRQLLCSCCVGSLHACCQVTEIGNTELIKTVAEITESLLKRIEDYGRNYRLETRYPGFDEALKPLIEELAEFKLEAEKVKNDKDVFQIRSLQEKVLALKAKVDTSFCFISFSAFVAHLYEALKARGVEDSSVAHLDFEQLLEKAKERMRKEFQKTEDRRFREEHERLSEEFKKQKAEIQQQAAQDKKELQTKGEHELKQREGQLKDLKKQLREKEHEMQETIDKLYEEVKSKETIIESLDVQGMRRALLSAIYSQTMGSKVDFTNDSELVIDLSQDKGKEFLIYYFCIISQFYSINFINNTDHKNCIKILYYYNYLFE